MVSIWYNTGCSSLWVCNDYITSILSICWGRTDGKNSWRSHGRKSPFGRFWLCGFHNLTIGDFILFTYFIITLDVMSCFICLGTEEETPPIENYPLWKVQTAVTWPDGNCCGWTWWVFWWQAVHISRRASWKAVSPKAWESADS